MAYSAGENPPNQGDPRVRPVQPFDLLQDADRTPRFWRSETDERRIAPRQPRPRYWQREEAFQRDEEVGHPRGSSARRETAGWVRTQPVGHPGTSALARTMPVAQGPRGGGNGTPGVIHIRDDEEMVSEERPQVTRGIDEGVDSDFDSDPGGYENQELCGMCLDRKRTRAFAPCGHCYACGKCARRLWHMDSPPARPKGTIVCPLCRKTVVEVIRMIFS